MTDAKRSSRSNANDRAATKRVRRWRRLMAVGLRHSESTDPGWTRRRCGRGFTFLDEHGRTIRDRGVRHRLLALAIPPAWNNVWICTDPRGHLQATGWDAAGRHQYIYHPKWHELQAVEKFDSLNSFAQRLPKLRRKLRRDLNRPGLSKKRVVASVIRVMDRGHLRVGNDRYLQSSGSRGATTLGGENVDLCGDQIQVQFRGKSGQSRSVQFRDPLVAKLLTTISDLDAQRLFVYEDRRGELRPIDSTDVNFYLRRSAGRDITAKTFRTWAGCVLALQFFHELWLGGQPIGQKKSSVEIVKRVAAELGNTPSVCRSSYIHPDLMSAASDGSLAEWFADTDDESLPTIRELNIDERRFLAWTERSTTRRFRRQAA